MLLLLAVACAPAPMDDSGSADVGVTPADYDCTATGVPARRTDIAWECGVDRTCADRLVTGHRGMGGELGVVAPENTVSAARAAIAYGVDFIETDPRPTADDVLVNLHDTTVDRTTQGTGDASELTYAEIVAMGIVADGYPGDYGCERTATLQEILSTAKGRARVLVDANKTDRVDLLVAAIQETDTLDEAIFDTSDPGKITEALALEPALHTMIRVEDEDQLAEQLALFEAHPPVIVEIPESNEGLSAAVLAAGHRVMMDVFYVDVAMGVNPDPTLYAPFYDEGIQILESDRPDLVLELLGR